ncbi:MAG: two-component sensor histidine kinase [Deltaproteobacteria bacterium]|nr:two-component sensor histidine kinase [Deltaproteobacteria bacterium]
MSVRSFWQKFLPGFFFEPKGQEGQDRLNYAGIWYYAVVGMLAVSLIPLLILAGINYSQYKRAAKAEILHPMYLLVSNNNQAIAFFLRERQSALNYVISGQSFTELTDPTRLNVTLDNLKKSFGGFIDLGLINADGLQINYSGPYELKGLNYHGQTWFKEVAQKGTHVSEVFKGFRGFPHVVIAVKHADPDGTFYILRATLDTEGFNAVIRAMDLSPNSDNFLINAAGVLQTASRRYGEALKKIPLTLPSASSKNEVIEITDEHGEPLIAALARVEGSPFIFVALKTARELPENLSTIFVELILFVLASILVIFGVTWRVSTKLVGHIHDVDRSRTYLLHEIEYTQRMASIGRLSAGVAHEINNPLAIINEKTGLLKDLIAFAPDFAYKERFLKHIDSILFSVKRCSTITHRLLGFARHLDVQCEMINPKILLEEVVSFLDKEAMYRNIDISLTSSPHFEEIESDRGQLQQVFLNIINNALAAVPDGGRVTIKLESRPAGGVVVTISDNGQGIPPENIERVFEPFFSTKGNKGTGLGLSIAHGIISKLGGEIFVESEVGIGTSFFVTLPPKACNRGRDEK